MVKSIKAHQKLPLLALAASFLCLGLITLVSSPVRSPSLILLFFALVLVLLISGLFSLLGVRQPLSLRRRRLVVVGSIYITVLLMFKSANSLGLMDVLILLLASAGVIFYLNRRVQ